MIKYGVQRQVTDPPQGTTNRRLVAAKRLGPYGLRSLRMEAVSIGSACCRGLPPVFTSGKRAPCGFAGLAGMVPPPETLQHPEDTEHGVWLPQRGYRFESLDAALDNQNTHAKRRGTAIIKGTTWTCPCVSLGTGGRNASRLDSWARSWEGQTGTSRLCCWQHVVSVRRSSCNEEAEFLRRGTTRRHALVRLTAAEQLEGSTHSQCYHWPRSSPVTPWSRYGLDSHAERPGDAEVGLSEPRELGTTKPRAVR